MAQEASISAVVRLWETSSKIESTGDAALLFGCAFCCAAPAAAGCPDAPPLISVELPSARCSSASRACRHTVGAGAAVLVVRGLGALSDRPASAKDSRHGREDVGAGGVGLSVLGDVRTRELACCFFGR